MQRVGLCYAMWISPKFNLKVIERLMRPRRERHFHKQLTKFRLEYAA
jgi:hypothetical protein